MHNNKGQVLVMFILLIPILVLLFSFITDIGVVNLNKKEVNSNIKETIRYGLNNMDEPNLENKLTDMLKSNIENIKKIQINISTNKIEIILNVEVKGIFNTFDKNIYKLKSDYIGTKEENKIKIEG